MAILDFALDHRLFFILSSHYVPVFQNMEVRFFFSDFICDFSTLLPTLLLRPKKLTFKNRWFAVFCMERTVRTISVRTVQMSIDHIQFQDQLAEPSIDKGSVTPKIV